MARSKNRRKKPKAKKKVNAKKTRNPAQVISEDDSLDQNAMESEFTPDEEYSGGFLVGMRDMISGGGKAEENMLSKRRSLGEWSLWLAGAGVIYYLIQYFLDN